METAEIIPSLSLEALLARRDAAIGCLERIRDAVKEYEEIGVAIDFAKTGIYSHAHSKWGTPVEGGRNWQQAVNSPDWFEWSSKTVDASLWEHLFSMSGIRTFMDAKAREEWSKTINENKTPPLTAENIRDTFRSLHEKRGEFFERGVIALFRSLSWDYKSNMPQKFGKRLVVRSLRDCHGFTNSDRCNSVDDLIRAFCILDEVPEPDHRDGLYQNMPHRESGEWANHYVRVRTFKNGNGHVYLLRPDLVERLNKILAKHHPNALPAEAA